MDPRNARDDQSSNQPSNQPSNQSNDHANDNARATLFDVTRLPDGWNLFAAQGAQWMLQEFAAALRVRVDPAAGRTTGTLYSRARDDVRRFYGGMADELEADALRVEKVASYTHPSAQQLAGDLLQLAHLHAEQAQRMGDQGNTTESEYLTGRKQGALVATALFVAAHEAERMTARALDRDH